MNINNISNNVKIAGAFKPGDKFICSQQLALAFGSEAVKEPCIVLSPTTTGLQQREDMVIVDLKTEDKESKWAHRSTSVFKLLENGEGWLFTNGADTLGNVAKGISANIYKTNRIKASRQMAVIINRVTGEAIMGYYLEKVSEGELATHVRRKPAGD